ncbi:response regulator receiver protein [Candidatus Koribacter versatilis Ellin345]|uniref:Response regulator receiver protein n=1 Tax=Koribacter versatilis (strain Ellin345) TaxID=204669 RepID=Q1IK85_KORVE|nr:response regulator [Candidatus Koribacter versatilis]ABF42715.1 response regulator receiver protein [Candidatus Koribacter versatilis Ellin345]
MTNHLISVVDDDDSTRRSTTLLIESFGFQAAGFESAESLLTSDQLGETLCLIVDVRMPGMNGLQLQRHLAAAGYKIPIVFITAYDDGESRRRAMQAGAVAFLPKPFTDELLLQALRSALLEQLKVKANLISVVDDDESIRRTMTLLIQSFGFQAAVFDSAENLLKSGQLHETSCLIVDVQMPGMNGLQLQGHLASSGYKIPIIFITAYDNKESRCQAMQAGAIAFLSKPFDDEVLLETIRATLLDPKALLKQPDRE